MNFSLLKSITANALFGSIANIWSVKTQTFSVLNSKIEPILHPLGVINPSISSTFILTSSTFFGKENVPSRTTSFDVILEIAEPYPTNGIPLHPIKTLQKSLTSLNSSVSSCLTTDTRYVQAY